MSVGLLLVAWQLAAGPEVLLRAEEGTALFAPRPDPVGRFMTLEEQNGDCRRLRLLTADGGPLGWVSARQDAGKGTVDQLLDLDGAAREQGFEYDLRWRPRAPESAGTADGMWCAFVSGGEGENADIYLARISDSGQDRLVRLTDHPAVELSPSWIADGGSLAFVSGRSGRGDLFQVGAIATDLGEKRPNRRGGSAEKTSRMVRLTENPREDRSPAWGPWGRFLAYAALQEDRPGGNLNYGVNLLDRRQAARPIRMTPNENLEELAPCWSPDGRYLACLVPRMIPSSNRSPGEVEWSGEEATILVAPFDPVQGRIRGRHRGPRCVLGSRDGGVVWLASGDLAYLRLEGDGYHSVVLCSAASIVSGAPEERVLLREGTLKRDLSVGPDGRSLYYIVQDGHRYALARLRLTGEQG